MPNRHDIHVLNDLIGATLDSAERLERVSDDSDSSGHVSLFASLAAERRDMAQTLADTVRALGGQPHDGGSILAKAQRAMMDVSHALMPAEAGIVGVADRGEAALDRRFEAAIKDERLSATTRETLRRAHVAIHRETHDVHDLHVSLESQRDVGSGLYPQ
ncbi:hypothetical protein BH09PSE1_BH09PSE1_15910 [soil metagenome]